MNKFKHYRKIGSILIILPLVIISLVLSSYVITTFITAGWGDVMSSTMNSIIIYINYILGFLGVATAIGIFICVPLGIFYLKKADSIITAYDKRSGNCTFILPRDSGESEIPKEIKGWNWGAAGLSIIWCLCHKIWFPIFILILITIYVPILGLLWSIVIGAMGNKWAWEKNKWESVKHFKDTQNKWRPWGGIIFGIKLLMTIGSVLSIF